VLYEVSPSTAELFPLRTPETVAKRVSPTGVPRSRLASVQAVVREPHKIGLEIAPSLGYCTGIQDGDDEQPILHRVFRRHPRSLGLAFRSVLIGGCVAFGQIGVVGTSDGEIGFETRSRDAALECRMNA
jgi:hypothetical protein